MDNQKVIAKTKELASLMTERFSMNPISASIVNDAWKKEFPDDVTIAERMLLVLNELESAKAHIAKQEKIIMNQDESLSLRRIELEDAKKRNTIVSITIEMGYL